ncbi:hypothetical protein ACWDXH_25020 [Micromonospora chokoriensis]
MALGTWRSTLDRHALVARPLELNRLRHHEPPPSSSTHDRLAFQETGLSTRPGHPDVQDPESINLRMHARALGARQPGTRPGARRTRPGAPGPKIVLDP